MLFIASIAGSRGVFAIQLVVPARACCIRIALLVAYIDASTQAAVSTVPLTFRLVILSIASHVSDPRLNTSSGVVRVVS